MGGKKSESKSIAQEKAQKESIETPQRNVEWRCLTCGQSAPPTAGDYMGLIRHKCEGKPKIRLVDVTTGEELATNIQQAQAQGLITGKKGKPLTAPQVSSEGIFQYTVTLPADAWTLFHIAKTFGLETDGDKPFDEWLWDCIKARFKYDYKKQIILAPVEEEKSG